MLEWLRGEVRPQTWQCWFEDCRLTLVPEIHVGRAMSPFSQEMEPPANPGRFISSMRVFDGT